MSDSPESIEETLEWLRQRFLPESTASVRALYQIELDGDRPGVIWARVDAGRLSVGSGRTPAPDVVFRMDSADFFGVLAGRENPDLLYMEGRVVVDGSLSLALKLRVIFSAPGRPDDKTDP